MLSRMTTSKETHPDLYCHYAHCHRKLSQRQLARNRIQAEFFNDDQMARYCCRRHKELARQNRHSHRAARIRAIERGKLAEQELAA